MPKRGNLPFLLSHILISPYCASFVLAGRCVVATKLNLHIVDYTQFWSASVVGDFHASRVRNAEKRRRRRRSHLSKNAMRILLLHLTRSLCLSSEAPSLASLPPSFLFLGRRLSGFLGLYLNERTAKRLHRM